MLNILATGTLVSDPRAHHGGRQSLRYRPNARAGRRCGNCRIGACQARETPDHMLLLCFY